MQNAPTRYMRRAEVPEYVQNKYGARLITKQRLDKLAVSGGGPFFRMWGRFPVYSAEDIDTWIHAILSAPVRSTAERRVQQARHRGKAKSDNKVA